jgi:hypothetical protein
MIETILAIYLIGIVPMFGFFLGIGWKVKEGTGKISNAEMWLVAVIISLFWPVAISVFIGKKLT